MGKEYIDFLEDDYYFDEDVANSVDIFFESSLVHIKGELAGQPFGLVDWQRDILHQIFAIKRKSDNMRRYRVAYIEVARKNGKALDINTPILTISGWKILEDILVGDKVLSSNGSFCNVVAITDIMIGRPCYEITFSDDSRFIADANHQWLINNGLILTTENLFNENSLFNVFLTESINFQTNLSFFDFEKYRVRQIKKIQQCPTIPTKCIQVDSFDSSYLVGERMIPTHNSTLCAGIALYCLLMDNEMGSEIYSAAADRDQASLVFDCAKNMVLANKSLSKVLETYRRSIVYLEEASSYKPISADAYTKHGFNAHCIIFDELHAQANRELVDVLHTSTGARRQPLELYITTAGYDRNSICWEYHDYALKCLEYRQYQRDLRDGKADPAKHRGIKDDTFLPVVFAAVEEDDWHSPDTWRKANPNMNISVSEEYLKKEHDKACELPAYENTFKRLHLSLWTSQQTRWIPMDAWDKCEGIVDAEQLKGKMCYAGLDLSATQDISALALLFPFDDIVKVLAYFWVPEENLAQRVKKDHVPYDIWARQGLIETTEGNVVDYDKIRKKINNLNKIYHIKEVACDKWNAVQIMTQLEGDGFTVASMTQGFSSLSAPTKKLEQLVLSGKFEHGANPILRWMANNVAVKQDSEGNVKIDKEKSTERIDGIAAIINAMARVIVSVDKRSIYETRGIITT